MVDVADMALDFTLPATGDTSVTLSALQPKAIVLFFYPRDNTAGCTKEAIGFTENLAAFDAAGAHVFGISKDNMASHERFLAKKELGMPLLSDADSEVCEAYGVWKEKKMYGKTFMGIERSTFLIDGTGRIANVWRKVKVDGHVQDVLDAVKALG
ncbi:peroxiredoxin [Shimia litoralis]|uniref:thioredoxin-dependent peroxiredoxin n=1 Tax=Shimia litoralis TaxID=420403 RepID=A0A4U7N8I0_9RHOB|nr:peroxiredoxin [Shimia litoralis]TKZ20904.1 peroxiredoxin [Shimia litoralis]